MAGHKRVYCIAVLLATLAGLSACGKSGFDTFHNCGTCTAHTFLFATAGNGISSFELTASGAATSLGSQSGPNQSEGIIADSSGSFLYVSDFLNGTIDGFTIDPSGGVLTRIAGSPFPAGPAPGNGGLAIDPSTKFLYVTLLNSAAVAGFSIAPGTGVLTPIAGSPFPAGNTPFQAIVDPAGKFLFVSNYNDSMGGISAYTINSASGALTPVPGSPFPTQGNFPGPNGLAIGGGGKFLYVGMLGTVNANNGVTVFSIDASSGVLTQIAGSPFPTGSEPIRVVTDPSGKFLFTANQQDNNVSAFTIDGTSGALTPVSGSPFATPGAPEALAVSSDGAFLYVGANGLSVFGINGTTGALTPISGSPFFSGQSFIGLSLAKP
jgi:6-phosphogluconolactonase (cycloisomerase 2 family)